MGKLKLSKYSPEVSEREAAHHLIGLTKGEHVSWLDHPCSKSLKAALEAYLDNLVLTWVRGGYSGNTSDEAAMSQARATGMAESIEWVKAYIDEMSKEETEYEEARNNSGW